MLWIGSGRFDGRIGDGDGPRACCGPDAGIGPSAQADGTVRQLAWGTRVVKLTTNSTVTSSTSGAVDREWPLRWANRRRQWAADVRCARSRHRPVGPGRRHGPAAASATVARGTRVVTGDSEATVTTIV